jgi:hypothetical protein
VDKNRLAVCVLGAGAVLIVLYLAQQASGESLTGTPPIETEAQFGGLALDESSRTSPGTPLDLDTTLHFFSPGYVCPGQNLTLTRHRYPVVAGGNVSTLIHRGFDAFKLGSPDNDWRVRPPSEYNL